MSGEGFMHSMRDGVASLMHLEKRGVQASALNVTFERLDERPVSGNDSWNMQDLWKADTLWGAHFKDVHNHLSPDLPFRVEIMCRAQDHPDRKFKEAITIAKERPQLNSDRGW